MPFRACAASRNSDTAKASSVTAAAA